MSGRRTPAKERNPKFEIRNPKQVRNSNFGNRNGITSLHCFSLRSACSANRCLSHCRFCYSFSISGPCADFNFQPATFNLQLQHAKTPPLQHSVCCAKREGVTETAM